MEPEEIAATENVTFAVVEAGNWLHATPLYAAKVPRTLLFGRVAAIDERDGRRLLLEGTRYGETTRTEWIVTRDTWHQFFWLRLIGLQQLEKQANEMCRALDQASGDLEVARKLFDRA